MRHTTPLVVVAALLLAAAPATAQLATGWSTGIAVTVNGIGPQADTHVVDAAGLVRVESHGDSTLRPMVETHVVWPAFGPLKLGPFLAAALEQDSIIGALGLGLAAEVSGTLRAGIGGWFERGDVLGSEFQVGQPPPLALDGTALPLRYEQRGLWSVLVFVGIDPTGF
jgi:hypothetical protein